MSSSEEVTKMSSQKSGETNDLKCTFCGRKVKDSMKCGKCFNIFHKLCIIKAANVRSSTCKHKEMECNESISSQVQYDVLEVENNLLKQLVKEMSEKNIILVEYNKLLQERIVLLEKNKKQNPRETYSHIVKNTNIKVGKVNRSNQKKDSPEPQKERTISEQQLVSV